MYTAFLSDSSNVPEHIIEEVIFATFFSVCTFFSHTREILYATYVTLLLLLINGVITGRTR